MVRVQRLRCRWLPVRPAENTLVGVCSTGATVTHSVLQRGGVTERDTEG